MKNALLLAAVASIVLLAGFARAPAAGAAAQSYTGCLSPILNAVYDVAPGEAPAHACVRPAAVIRLSSGDVTSLAAGTGLAGGGDNGDLALSIAPSFRLPQACSNGQTASWNGTAWVCASGASQADFNAFVALLASSGTVNGASNPVHWTKLKGVPAGFADGTDDVGPSYAAGAGLNLTGTTFSVDPTQIQQRITQTCAVGSSIRAIAQDGTVTCQGHSSYTAGEGLALNAGQFSVADGGVTPSKLSFDPTTQEEFNAFSTLLGSTGTINDSANPVDWSKLKDVPAGLADGVDNVGVGGLRDYCGHAQSNPFSFPDAPCRAQLRVVDAAGDAGGFTSLAIGTDGNPVISYFSTAGNGDLVFAHCNDPTCSGDVTHSLIDFLGSVGRYTSLAIGTDGNPVMSYYDATHGDLKVAHCDDPACAGGGETVSTVDATGDAGGYSSLAIGSDGNPVISYQDQELGNDRFLKVAHCNDPACAGGDETVSTVAAGNAGFYTSLAIGTDGNPVVSYETSGSLTVAQCNDPACAGGNEAVSTVDGFGDNSYTSLTIGTDGNPVMSYFDQTFGELRVARCNDPACEGGNETVSSVDTGGDAGAFNSIAIGTDGNPVISYYAGTDADLKVARCNDAACAGGGEAISTVDAAGNVGVFTSVAIGTDGIPVVSYEDATHASLKVARPAVSG